MNGYGYGQPGVYSNYGYPPQSVAPVPPPPPPPVFNQRQNDNADISYANFVRPGMPPNPMGAQNGPPRSFPNKTNFQQNARGGKRNSNGFRKKVSNNAEALTPAALLNQTFKNITESYAEVAKTCFQCTLAVNGQEFSMDASTKKHAKQKAAELALRTLCPDMSIPSFESGVSIKPLSDVNPMSNTLNQNAMPVQAVEPPSKRPKGDQISNSGSAVSIGDFLRKICDERISEGPFNAKFNIIEMTNEGEDTKKMFKCTLSFAEQGRHFVKEHITRAGAKDLACIQALTEMFKVTNEQLRNIARRSILCKSLGKQPTANSSVSTLHQVAMISLCEIKWDISVASEVGKDKGSGTGVNRYECILTVIDQARDNKQVKFTSPPMPSKQAAKEYAAVEILRSYFLIDPADAGSAKNVDPSPISQLYNFLAKHKRNETPVFEEMGFDSNERPAVFRCKVQVGAREYVASGSTKKAAKHAVAAVALQDMFSHNVFANTAAKIEPEEPVEGSCSKFCTEICTFTKDTYFKMCHHLNLSKGTSVAGICLVNEKDEKRVVSLATSLPHVVNLSGVVTSQGTSIVHMDPVVLAKRSFNRYLLSEIEKANTDPTTCIVMRAEDGRWKIKPTIRVVIFSSRPPALNYDQPADARKRLATISCDATIEPTLNNVLGPQEIHNDDYLRVHTAADKIFKWTQLGMQGGLLSNIMHPVIPYGVMFASGSQHSPEDLQTALTNRLGNSENTVVVDYLKCPLPEVAAPPLVYTKDLGHEQLDLHTGKTIVGAASKYSKSGLFEAFKKLKDVPRETSYMAAKDMATEYSTNKKEFYDKLSDAGFGRWQQKPARLLDFTDGFFD